MIFKFTGFIFILFSPSLPVLNILSQFVDILFKFDSNLLAFGDFDFIVSVVVDLRMELQLFVFQSLNVIVLRPEQII